MSDKDFILLFLSVCTSQIYANPFNIPVIAIIFPESNIFNKLDNNCS